MLYLCFMAKKNIPKGTYNFLLSKLGLNAEKIEEVATKRMLICNECPSKDKTFNKCKECGCFLPAKTRVLDESCPLDKWKPYE